ncbi:MAG TPA: hypothetical protein VKE69_08460 [Planctomycetota bacterium]|nr:hypothetical protein [Planctomycetota bacterium]
MTEPTPPPPPPPAKSFVPRPLPPPPKKRPLLMTLGGKVGLAVFLGTIASLLYFGTVLWGRVGPAVQKVFRTNASTSYDSRDAFFRSRFAEIEKAGPDRRFGFFSPSTPHVLKAYREGPDLVLDASDARDDPAAVSEARQLPLFEQPGADLDRLRVRFPPPRDPAVLARAADVLFVSVLDGAPEGLDPDEITLDDLPETR